MWLPDVVADSIDEARTTGMSNNSRPLVISMAFTAPGADHLLLDRAVDRLVDDPGCGVLVAGGQGVDQRSCQRSRT